MPKPIIVTDDSVINDQGFRVMTDGGDLTLYLKNPIMLYDHTRRNDDDTDVILPIGTMKELTRQGNQLIATPEFDLDDDFAKKIAAKYDKGIFNMASIGFEALEWSEDPSFMLPGQRYPTITKWVLKEISITDIGSNPNCCKVTHAGKVLTLSAGTNPEDIKNFFNSNKPNPSMKKVIAALNASKLVQLNEASTEELVAESVSTITHQLSAKDQKIASQADEITTLKAQIDALKNSGLNEKAVILVDGALASKKIVATQKENFVKLAAASEEGYISVKAVLDSLKAYESPMTTLTAAATAAAPVGYSNLKDEFQKRSAEPSDSPNSLETLKSTNPEHFKAVYKAGTGKEFKS